MGGMDESLPQLRIGDRERRAVDDRLQHAVGDGILTLGEYDERSGRLWSARTQGELDLLTADLPAVGAVRPTALAPPTGQRPRRLLAVLSGDELVGPPRPGQPVHAYAVLGEARVDLRGRDLPAEVHVRAVAALGEVSVVVPRGATVHLSGLSFMGSREVRVERPAPGGQIVHIDARALLGSVHVRHGDGAPAERSGNTPDRDNDLDNHRDTGRDVDRHPDWDRHRDRSPNRRRRRANIVRPLLGAALAVGVLAGGVSVARGEDATAVFGSATRTQDGPGRVDVGTLFGSVEVVVPDGARVRTSGTIVFGSLDCGQACSPGETGPVIEVHGSGGFGSVEVKTVSEAQNTG